MAQNDLKLETRFSKPSAAGKYTAVGLAVAVLIAIVVVTTTDVATRLLPMDEAYRDVLVPTVADGSQPLSLHTLNQKEDAKAGILAIDGVVMNRTESAISGLLAVVQVNDRFTLPAQTVEVPVEPAELPSMAEGKFQTTVMIGQHGLGGYVLQFKLPNEGPFVPHLDERPPAPAPAPEIKTKK